MSIFNGDASEIFKLASDLSQVGGKTVPAMRGVMEEAGRALADDWRANAVETSGTHGIHYPQSIDHELSLSVRSIGVEVGPNSAKKQGGMGMGFEFGSVNQPPHLDGLRALDGIQKRVERMFDSSIGHLFP